MGKFGDKFLNFIGVGEEEPEDNYDDEYDYDEDEIGNENLQEDMIDFKDNYYEEPEDDRRNFKSHGRKSAQSAPKYTNTQKVVEMPDPSKVKVIIYKPASYEDAQTIIDNLKERKSIVVNLDELETDIAQRILDFISGAVYALNGNIRKAARNIFVVAPFNVDVSTGAGEYEATDDYDFDPSEQ